MKNEGHQTRVDTGFRDRTGGIIYSNSKLLVSEVEDGGEYDFEAVARPRFDDVKRVWVLDRMDGGSWWNFTRELATWCGEDNCIEIVKDSFS